jgi:hypothetical protein
MTSITAKFSLIDTHNAHTITFTSWYKVSLEITIIKHLSRIIDEEPKKELLQKNQDLDAYIKC